MLPMSQTKHVHNTGTIDTSVTNVSRTQTPQRRLVRVPDDLWAAFRIQCLKQHITLADGLNVALRNYIDDQTAAKSAA